MLKKTHFSIICAAVMSFMVSASFAEISADSNADVMAMSQDEADKYVSKTVDGKMTVIVAPNKKDQNKLLNWEEKMKEEKAARDKKALEHKKETLTKVHESYPNKVENKSEKAAPTAKSAMKPAAAPVAKPAMKAADKPVTKPSPAAAEKPAAKPTPGKVTHDTVAPKTKVSDWQKMMDDKKAAKEKEDALKRQKALDAELQANLSEDGSKKIVNQSEAKYPKLAMAK